MHTTPDLAAQIVYGYVIVADMLNDVAPIIHGTGSHESALGIVADVTADWYILQATLWAVRANHAERLGVYAGAHFGPEATT